MKTVNDGLSAYIMGRNYYSQENNYEQNYQYSYDYYKQGVDKFNDPRCLYGLAMFYYDDGESESENIVPKDNQYANKLFLKAYPRLAALAKESDMYSIFILGAYYNYGLGNVKKSFSTALKYIKKAADLGHQGALYDMGRFYEIGRGVEKDIKKATFYYKRAATLGKLQATSKVANILNK